jgi:two-component system OmpR family sensor kinase
VNALERRDPHLKSLRATLLAWLLGAVLVVGLGGGYLIYRNSLAEANAFFDYHLRATAMLLRDQAYGFAPAPGLPREVPEYDFVVQVWTVDGRRVYVSDTQAHLPSRITLGFSTETSDDGRFRTFSVIARDYLIQVAQPMVERERRAARLAFRTLLPFGVLMPVLALLIGWIVNRSLSPLNELALRLRRREPMATEPVAAQGLPDEVTPLVDALNDLLRRLATALEHERAFIADAAHELRTPLTALRLQLDALSTAEESPERQRAMARLDSGVSRATRLVEQLLAMARLDQRDAPRPERVELEPVAREVVEELLPLADSKRIDIGVEAAPGIAVTGDRQALAVLLRNLVDNALRYTPEEGRVDVRIVRAAGNPERSIVLEVADTGPGIPAEERERVFDRFYRVPGTAAPGSGIGLALVKMIAERHAARVELESRAQGRGLVVRVRFPDGVPVGELERRNAPEAARRGGPAATS